MNSAESYDVIVVGGGHAGTEAALACSRMGARTLLLTHNLDTLGQMSCNPAIGGIGKGHLVKEIDAMGGLMARAADQAGIQFRILNARKGPAVRATRAQIDRLLYRQAVRTVLEAQPNLVLFQQAVDDLVLENGRVTGVVTAMGLTFRANAVVLTVGTFLGGIIHVGLSNTQGGRAGDPPANALAKRLRELPFRVGRLKTGTPPRLDRNSLDFSVMQQQPGDDPLPSFSYMGRPDDHPRQLSCHITHTNCRTHEIIRQGLDRSPMYTGVIEGVGPRYCPSIEDKVMRFADKGSHQIFVEPEGLNVSEIYPNGISTSLPYDVQLALVHSIAGFERARITRPGYAIEYDYFDPRDLRSSLESRFIDGLFFAGQINGTTGYEEAAAQGLVAGINAVQRQRGEQAWCPRRDEAYIGVLIDDLISRGTSEPYRMFTSRAEYRLMLREDNADLRLTPQGRQLGLVDDARFRAFEKKQQAISKEQARLQSICLTAESGSSEQAQRILGAPMSRQANLLELLKRPDVSYYSLLELSNTDNAVDDPKVAEQIEIQARYAGYIDRQQVQIERQRRHEDMQIPESLDFADISGLSNEVCQKLSDHRPGSIGQAGRIPGVTPAAISLLLVHLKRHGRRRA